MPTSHSHSIAAPKLIASSIDTILAAPGRVLLLASVLIVALGAGLGKVIKEPSVDAFVPADHAAAKQRDRARDLFGIEDPIIVLLVDERGESLFRSDALQALRSMHQQFRLVPGVRRSEVISIASEKSIRGLNGDLQVDPILGAGPISTAQADAVAQRFLAMPMLVDFLGRADGRALTLIVPVDDPNHAVDIYNEIRRIGSALAPPGTRLHVAGVAGMNARLAQTVDSDTRVLIPAAIVTVLLMLMLTLRSAKACIGPLLVIAAAALVSIGLMGWLDARYYLITTALPVVIMAMAVADCVHINLFYLRYRSTHPQADARAGLRHALMHTWRPVALTSITTMAGLCGLSLGAAMQPIREFGLFAAVGVFAAWILSMSLLPAVMLLLDLPARPQPARWSLTSHINAVVQGLTQASLRRPGVAITGLLLTLLVLAGLATQARFDYERQRYFHADDAVRIADQTLAEQLGGFNFLDVVVTAPEADALMTASAQQAMQDLAQAIAGLDLVNNVSAMPDYIAHMHQVLTDAASGALPQQESAPAQYLFLYEAGGEPDDFHTLIDYDQQHALIRARLDTDRFSRTQPVVQALTDLTTRWSASSGLQAAISGRVAVNEGWMQHLAEHHVRGLTLAMLLVLLVASLAFRAISPALLALLPVAVGVLFIYAVMGLFKIDIAPATSMSAAIATGLGVDFGIHLISHLRRQLQSGVPLQQAFADDYLLIARACLFSAIALLLALAVIGLSTAPPLRWFGLLVGAGAFGSLLGALVLIPAAVALTRVLHQWRFSHA